MTSRQGSRNDYMRSVAGGTLPITVRVGGPTLTQTAILYHYTSEAGFNCLTTGSHWYPSTELPIISGRSLQEHMQLSIDLARRSYYSLQYASRSYDSARSSAFKDTHYGPGWYLTALPPDTPTDVLFESLWQGRASDSGKAAYWLKIIGDTHRFKIPDAGRQSISYLPVYDQLGGEAHRPAGVSSAPVYLVEAGRRSQLFGAKVDVSTLRRFDPPVELVPPMIVTFDSWSHLTADDQANVLGYLGFDSGFPGARAPLDSGPLRLSAQQLFAAAQIAIRSLGADFSLSEVTLDNERFESSHSSFYITGQLSLASGSTVHVVANCRYHHSPMRLQHVRDFLAFSAERDAGLRLAFVTSTFSLNAIPALAEARAVPLMVGAQIGSPRRPTCLIVGDEMVEVPDHSFWVASASQVQYERIRGPQQVLDLGCVQ